MLGVVPICAGGSALWGIHNLDSFWMEDGDFVRALMLPSDEVKSVESRHPLLLVQSVRLA